MIVRSPPPLIHSVLRLIITLDGEDVIDGKSILCYSYEGMKKIARKEEKARHKNKNNNNNDFHALTNLKVEVGEPCVKQACSTTFKVELNLEGSNNVQMCRAFYA